MRDVVILFVHLIVVSYPARLCLLVSPGVISSFAEFPLTSGTAKTVAQKISATPNEDQAEEKDK